MPQVSRTFASKKTALAALAARVEYFHAGDGKTSGQWKFARLWVENETLHAYSDYHAEHTIETLLSRKYKNTRP